MNNYQYFIKKNNSIKLIILFLLAIAIAILIGWWNFPDFKTKSYFASQPIKLNTYDLFDLGIVDADNDNNLDIFTTNHSSQQSLLLNQTQGKFIDNFSQWNLNQDPIFAKVEIADSTPKLDQGGLYIFRTKNFQWNKTEADNLLVLHTQGINKPFTGKIEFISPIKIKRQDNFTIKQTEEQLTPEIKLTTVDFTAPVDGELVIETHLAELPTKFKFDQNISTEQIYLGQDKQQPQSNQFSLHWKDRHGMAWADYNSDRAMDVLISRGGLKGTIADFRKLDLEDFLQDELFTNSPNGFVDQTVAKGIEKSSCPGRQAGWVDFNQDNRLDLYIVCGKGTPPGALSPNQLHQQQEDGTFIDVASQVGLAHQERGSFVWLDSDNDGDLDFLWANKSQFQLYLNQQGQFKPQTPIVKSNQVKVEKLAVGDFDRDGDLDIYAAQPKKSVILKNIQGTYEIIDPNFLGLPTAALTANWVDYDNDGLLDLHVLPSGLYRQLVDGKFTATHLLEAKFSLSEFDEARSAWFDYDNDGQRDLLIAARYRPWWVRIISKVRRDIPDPRSWQAHLYRNLGNTNHWLEIKLIGSSGNPQAIGTKVTVTTNNGQQIQQVGQAEGSHYSQGHYRLYFGLGQQLKPEQVKVEWSNGQTQIITNPPSDRLLTIEQSINPQV